MKQINNFCTLCDQNDQYIDILNDRIGKLERLVEKLSNTAKSTQPKPKIVPDFFNMEMEQLINLSKQMTITNSNFDYKFDNSLVSLSQLANM